MILMNNGKQSSLTVCRPFIRLDGELNFHLLIFVNTNSFPLYPGRSFFPFLPDSNLCSLAKY